MTTQERADWIESEAGLVLLGGQCGECGRKFFPEKQNCPGCGASNVSPIELSRRGRLYTYSTIHAAPRGFQAPYTVGFVDLEDGVRVFGQIDGAGSDLILDGLMEPVLGVIRTSEAGEVQGYKFRRAA